MMNIVPTHRPWITASRVTVAIVLLAVASSATLMLAGPEPAAMACLASAQ